MCFQVEYQCEGFLEKNKDTVFEEQIKVLKSSKVTMYRLSPIRIYSLKCFLFKHSLFNSNNNCSNKISFTVSFLFINTCVRSCSLNALQVLTHLIL